MPQKRDRATALPQSFTTDCPAFVYHRRWEYLNQRYPTFTFNTISVFGILVFPVSHIPTLKFTSTSEPSTAYTLAVTSEPSIVIPRRSPIKVALISLFGILVYPVSYNASLEFTSISDSSTPYTNAITFDFIISTFARRVPAEIALFSAPPWPRDPAAESDSELELRQDHSMLYTAQKLGQGSSSFRTRLWTSAGGRQAKPAVPKSIATGPGQTCAGETETETDEPPRHLPTARIVPSSGPIVPPHTLEQLLTPLLFEASRLLSIVPAVFGTLYNVYYVWHPPLDGKNTRVDYVVSALWAILTGVQCLLLTTGLLHRWKVYYPPLSTLIRLLALQAICWPATHLTLSVFEYDKRPVICWAVIGSTTCVSRSIQLWVTSNLWWETDGRGEGKGWRLKLGGRWGGRRWDWVEVLVKCMLPMGICYFVMAWAEALRREWDGC
ncbi:hypothetical protein EWM64_g9486 [Hericium alpestre]|uniref:Uncharacterized protein n=1 Tax=Hericium alpestre TaxID=135208 RepID=A0A4Y9ZKH4_9AGAM|nr:hypothetical protein EWM64_g9486 [Hericium alpestre]